MARMESDSGYPRILEHKVMALDKVREALEGIGWITLSPYLHVDENRKAEWQTEDRIVHTKTAYHAALLAPLGQLKLERFGADEDKALDPLYIHPFAGRL
ncbi:MAG: hypothetical protein D6677_08485 [Calditrichaeota bacterium]|nr:MAG: hypothetical protein D6677_08485 [Calditrichota bacterium]